MLKKGVGKARGRRDTAPDTAYEEKRNENEKRKKRKGNLPGITLQA